MIDRSDRTSMSAGRAIEMRRSLRLGARVCKKELIFFPPVRGRLIYRRKIRIEERIAQSPTQHGKITRQDLGSPSGINLLSDSAGEESWLLCSISERNVYAVEIQPGSFNRRKSARTCVIEEKFPNY